MGLSAEFQRNIDGIVAAGGNSVAEADEKAGLFTQLPVEEQEQVATIEEPTSAQSPVLVVARSTLHEQLYEELKARGQEAALPEPPKGLIEIQTILTGEGFEVEPIVYVGPREVTYALFDRSERPNWGDKDYPTDAYSPIVQRGRRGEEIKLTDWTRDLRDTTRFGLSWDNVHNFVAPAVVNLSPHLAEQVKINRVVFRVPTRPEFQTAGLRYSHLGKKRSWEHLYDDAGRGSRFLGGYSDEGGLEAVGRYPSDLPHDYVWFRLQAAFPPQTFPR